MRVRPAKPDDLDAVAVLFDQYRSFYGEPADRERARAFIGERMRRAESIVLVAEAPDAALAGFVQLYPGFSSVSAARIHVLNDLYVDAARRRQGIGRLLLEAAHHAARDAGAVRMALSTARDNLSAQALYASLGWVRDDRFLHYTLAVTPGPAPERTA